MNAEKKMLVKTDRRRLGDGVRSTRRNDRTREEAHKKEEKKITKESPHGRSKFYLRHSLEVFHANRQVFLLLSRTSASATKITPRER